MYKVFAFEDVNKIIKENNKLKMEVKALREQCINIRSWSSLKDGIILPRLVGMGLDDYAAKRTSNDIAQILKEFLNINRIDQINGANFDKAEKIALGILDVLSQVDLK